MNVETLTELNIILSSVSLDMKAIINENYNAYGLTDYKKLLAERKKINRIEFEEVFDPFTANDMEGIQQSG